ncbi:helix-turn-helix transcriptional regulator [Bacillus sp. CMF12]|uniref:helix-turn-helix domain-containing protein n=1 Tax=Bacillaceae TaxID=186817 RepID=UPI001FB21CF1|nr:MULTISPECIES: helix-turn-helix domain-containing protein [Bacillaceae]UOE55187.1 helix-turn-helix transcriptional regulator [Cytobacillus oceanisediminis]USK49638.1 helix-turn-helix transcriptional regulator [Bacillus sp. CMF12]
MNLSEYLIGDSLQSFRQYKGLSVKELAEGICSEEELVSFEKEKAYPSLETLNQLANKMNIDLTYFFNIASKSTINYSTAVMQIINKHKRNWNYQAIYEIVQKELENPIFQPVMLKQFLVWHQGICVFYLENDFDKAIELLHGALDLTNEKRVNLSEREVEILTSIAILYKDMNLYTEAISMFKKGLNDLEKLPHILESRGKVRILFGLSQALTEIGEFQESLVYCQKGIEICIHEEIQYLFANLHYQSGENYIKFGNKEKGIEFLQKAIYILQLQRNDKFIQIIESEMEKLLNKC